jgi:hypothetical protein
MKLDLEWFEGLTDKELTDIGVLEAMRAESGLSDQQRDLLVALTNRIAKYNPEIERVEK